MILAIYIGIVLMVVVILALATSARGLFVRPGFWLTSAGAVAAALGLYFYLGSPHLPDQPLRPRIEKLERILNAPRLQP